MPEFYVNDQEDDSQKDAYATDGDVGDAEERVPSAYPTGRADDERLAATEHRYRVVVLYGQCISASR